MSSTNESLLDQSAVLFDVIDGLLNSGDLFSFFVWDFALEFFFQRHNEFDGVKRVGAQIIYERCVIGDIFFNAQLLCNNFFYSLFNITHNYYPQAK